VVGVQLAQPGKWRATQVRDPVARWPGRSSTGQLTPSLQAYDTLLESEVPMSADTLEMLFGSFVCRPWPRALRI